MPDLVINQTVISRFLTELSEPWQPNNHFHFRMLRENYKPHIANFAPHAWDEMMEHLVKMNKTHNVYVGANPVPDDAPHSPSDVDIKCAHFAFVDADDGEQTRRARAFTSFEPHMETTTGTEPSERVHLWYKFDQPMTDMKMWSQLQKRLAGTMQTDDSVCNPSRLIRVAGTISYPSPSKIERKYIIEATTLSVGGCHVD